MSEKNTDKGKDAFAKPATTVNEMRDQLAQAVVDLRKDASELDRAEAIFNAAGKYKGLCEVEVVAQVAEVKFNEVQFSFLGKKKGQKCLP